MSLFLSNKYGNSLVPCALPKQSFHPPSDLNLSADNAGGKPILTHSKNSASIKCLLLVDSSLIRPTRIGHHKPPSSYSPASACPLNQHVRDKSGTAKKKKGGPYEQHVLNFPGTTMCFTTCYWGLPRRTGRSSSCCHPKSSPTSSRYRTVCLTVFFLLIFPAMPQLISSKWGPRSFCKSSQLPAHTLCCILMKFPLFPVAPFLLHQEAVSETAKQVAAVCLAQE